MKYIIKRDGRKEEFDGQKIMDAIMKAWVSVDGSIDDYGYDKAYQIALYIENLENEGKELTIEEIQDLVENGLMNTKRKDIARAYIKYRADRNRNRERISKWMQEIHKKIAASDVQNQNANIDEYSFGGRKGEADSVLMKKLALDELVSPMAKMNHEENMIYIHDLDSYAIGMHNCLSIPFDDLLSKGFNTRQADIRPANSINTAFQLLAVIFQLQSLQQFGGCSATHLDWTMVLYVRKSFYKHYKDGLKYLEHKEMFDLNSRHPEDISINEIIWKNYPHVYDYALEMTEKEIEQAVEGMFHNLNTLQSRSGNQLEKVAA